MLSILSSAVFSEECQYSTKQVNDSTTVTRAVLGDTVYTCFNTDTYTKILHKMTEGKRCIDSEPLYLNSIKRCDEKDSLRVQQITTCEKSRDEVQTEYNELSKKAEAEAGQKYVWFGTGFGIGAVLTSIAGVFLILATGK